jgi:hypothetical protein
MPKFFGRNPAKVLAGGLMVVVSLFLAEGSRGARPASAGETIPYKWNLAEKGLPLLDLSRDRLRPGFAQSLTYPFQGGCST